VAIGTLAQPSKSLSKVMNAASGRAFVAASRATSLFNREADKCRPKTPDARSCWP
jgi:hypothetical protein